LVEAELRELMLNTLSWKRCTSINGRNVKTYADTETAIPGYWDKKISQRLDASGQWVATGGQYICDGSYPIGMNDELTMEDGTTPAIAWVQQLNDENGPYVTVITLGR
jgi:hypothetical protein